MMMMMVMKMRMTMTVANVYRVLTVRLMRKLLTDTFLIGLPSAVEGEHKLVYEITS